MVLAVSSERGGPRLLVISGPSGVGKSTVIAAAAERFPHVAQLKKSTTRSPRRAERHATEFEYLRSDEFDAMQSAGQFAAWSSTYGTAKYGLRTDLLQEIGERVGLVDLDPLCVVQLRDRYEIRAIMVRPPRPDVIRARLRQRGDCSEDEIERRIVVGGKIVEHQALYDVILDAPDQDEFLKAVERHARTLLRAVHAQ
jgi:guanylate kinase